MQRIKHYDMHEQSILIVDDEITNLEIIVQILDKSEEEYKIYRANNVELAYSIAIKKVPNLVITDWEMPEKTGIELIKMLKNNPLTQEIPVIMCSGVMTSSKNLKTALEAGAVDYIRKPIDEIELIARIKSMLKLSDSYQEIKKLNNTKDTIFTIIAHDLRTPVANTYSMIDLLLSGEVDPQGFNIFLQNAKKHIGATYNLLENLLSWANMQRGNLAFMPENINITEIIGENLTILSENANLKNIKLIFSPHQFIQTAFADKNMIMTVIRNLISNSIKFTNNNGTIKIVTKPADIYLIVSIEDNGVGMSEEMINKIMTNHEHITTYGTMNEKGSGLGLQLCREFVLKNKGDIWVKSIEGKGTTFNFTVPLQKIEG